MGDRAGRRPRRPRRARRRDGASCARSSSRSDRRATSVRTIHASSPAAPSPWSFVRPYAESGLGPVRLDVRLALRPVEDVVGREGDERRAERRRIRGAGDVDGGCALRVLLGPVDVRPGGGMQDQVGRRARRRREGDVPVGVPERDQLVVRERLLERAAELTARAGDDYAAASRAERIGSSVLHRCLTRGSDPGDAVLVRIRRVVLLRHVVDEQQIGERLEAVRVAAGDVEGDRVLVADVLGVGLTALAIEHDDARRPVADRRRDRPGPARDSGGPRMTPRRENETFVCDVRRGSRLSRRSSMNQPRSSSNRRSGTRTMPVDHAFVHARSRRRAGRSPRGAASACRRLPTSPPPRTPTRLPWCA